MEADSTSDNFNVKKDSKEIIINRGNMIINKKSKTGKQRIKNEGEQKESNWPKANVIIALLVGIASIVGVLWQILKIKSTANSCLTKLRA